MRRHLYTSPATVTDPPVFTAAAAALGLHVKPVDAATFVLTGIRLAVDPDQVVQLLADHLLPGSDVTVAWGDADAPQTLHGAQIRQFAGLGDGPCALIENITWVAHEVAGV